jgi:hypothetical protein
MLHKVLIYQLEQNERLVYIRLVCFFTSIFPSNFLIPSQSGSEKHHEYLYIDEQGEGDINSVDSLLYSNHQPLERRFKWKDLY